MRTIQEPTTGRTRLNRWAWRGIRLTRVLGILLCSVPMHATSVPGATILSASTVTLAWNRSPGSEVTGYRIYYGVASGSYANSVTVGNVTSNSIPGLTNGVTYFFAVKAYDANGVESVPSNEISFLPGRSTLQIGIMANRQVILTVKGLTGHTYDIQATSDLKTWTTIGTVTVGASGSTDFTNTPSLLKRFYRTRDTQP